MKKGSLTQTGAITLGCSAALSNSSEAEFHKYFVANVAEDMKKKMISPSENVLALENPFSTTMGQNPSISNKGKEETDVRRTKTCLDRSS